MSKYICTGILLLSFCISCFKPEIQLSNLEEERMDSLFNKGLDTVQAEITDSCEAYRQGNLEYLIDSIRQARIRDILMLINRDGKN